MALEIPTVMSRVSGFSIRDWVKAISLLIDSSELRKTIGCNGRKTVLAKFSVEANKMLYLKYFNQVVQSQVK